MVTVSSIKEHPHSLFPGTATTHICMQGHLSGHKGQVAVRHNLGHTGVHKALHVCGDKLLIPDSGQNCHPTQLGLTFPALQGQ